MKYRLTKKQVQMLLDGKTLTAGARKFAIPNDFEGRKRLEEIVAEDEFPTVFVDTTSMCIEVI